jgi:myosin heavy subunit
VRRCLCEVSRGYCADHHRQTYGASSSSSSSSSASKSAAKLGGAAALFDAATVGCDDMILLPSPSEKTITENLQMRHKRDIIYSYIGQVLVSVNPFKQLKIYTPETITQYSNKASHENPPHTYALAETAYRTMRNEEENQCVIISGESGAGQYGN